MGNQPPAFQFYGRDFDASTKSWELSEVGAYVRLLIHQWECGAVPNDLREICRVVGAFPDELETIWETRLREKFPQCDDGKRRNNRLERVRKAQLDYREKKAAAGRKSAEVRRKKYGSAKPQTDPSTNTVQNSDPNTDPNGVTNTVPNDVGTHRRTPARTGHEPSSLQSPTASSTASSTNTPPSPPLAAGAAGSLSSEDSEETKNNSNYPAEFERWWSAGEQKFGPKKPAAAAWKKLGADRPPTNTLITVYDFEFQCWQVHDSHPDDDVFWPRPKDAMRWLRDRCWERDDIPPKNEWPDARERGRRIPARRSEAAQRDTENYIRKMKEKKAKEATVGEEEED